MKLTGKKKLIQLSQIIEGYIKKFFKMKPTYQKDRLEICSICPINVKGICSKELGGCGCNLEAKTACKTCKCPIQKW